MAIIRFVTAVKNSALDTIKTAIDAGSGAGTIKIYTGTQPTSPADAITTQTLLGTLTFSDPCGTSASGTLTMSAITQDSSADATGTATWARIADSTGATVCDVDVTATGGGGTLQFNTTSFVIGGPILISAFTITVP
jgi:hypothetical protein